MVPGDTGGVGRGEGENISLIISIAVARPGHRGFEQSHVSDRSEAAVLSDKFLVKREQNID